MYISTLHHKVGFNLVLLNSFIIYYSRNRFGVCYSPINSVRLSVLDQICYRQRFSSRQELKLQPAIILPLSNQNTTSNQWQRSHSCSLLPLCSSASCQCRKPSKAPRPSTPLTTVHHFSLKLYLEYILTFRISEAPNSPLIFMRSNVRFAGILLNFWQRRRATGTRTTGG